MSGEEDVPQALTEASSLEAFLDARLPGGDAGFVGWTRAAAAAAVASASWAPSGPAELGPLLERWAARPNRELLSEIAAAVARTSAGAEPAGGLRGLSPLETAAAALAGVGSPWRTGAELAIDAARRACRGEPDRHALERAVAATLRGPPPENLAPPRLRSAASVPPAPQRLPPGWRPAAGFDDALGRERSGVSAPREWEAEPDALEHVARSLEVALHGHVLELGLSRLRTRALRAELRLELGGVAQARVRLDRDPRGSAEASILVFGADADARVPDLCAALDEALHDAARRHPALEPRARPGPGLSVHARDAAQSVTSLLRGRPILPSGARWVDDDAVGPWPFECAFAVLVPLADALEDALAAPGSIAIHVRGRAPHARVQLTIDGELSATIDAHAAEVRVRAPSHATVATVVRALAAAAAASGVRGVAP